MTDRVKLARVGSLLEQFDYPVDRDTVAKEFDDVTVLMADGEANLGSLVSKTRTDRFSSVEDLSTELNNVMPIEALGEPGQSEGDA